VRRGTRAEAKFQVSDRNHSARDPKLTRSPLRRHCRATPARIRPLQTAKWPAPGARTNWTSAAKEACMLAY
jgi:hypothetical protein